MSVICVTVISSRGISFMTLPSKLGISRHLRFLCETWMQRIVYVNSHPQAPKASIAVLVQP